MVHAPFSTRLHRASCTRRPSRAESVGFRIRVASPSIDIAEIRVSLSKVCYGFFFTYVTMYVCPTRAAVNEVQTDVSL